MAAEGRTTNRLAVRCERVFQTCRVLFRAWEKELRRVLQRCSEAWKQAQAGPALPCLLACWLGRGRGHLQAQTRAVSAAQRAGTVG